MHTRVVASDCLFLAARVALSETGSWLCEWRQTSHYRGQVVNNFHLPNMDINWRRRPQFNLHYKCNSARETAL